MRITIRTEPFFFLIIFKS